MRILVVSQVFWPENFRINDLTADLVQRGHEVTVLTGYPNYPGGDVYPEFLAEPQRYSRYGAVEVVRVPIIPRAKSRIGLMLNYLTFVLSTCTIGAWLLRRRVFDVAFVFEPSPVTVGLPAVVQRWLKGVPIVFWVLDLWPDTLAAVGAMRNRFGLAMVGSLVRFIYSQCALVLAQSRGFVPRIRELAPQRVRVEYFPSWAETVYGESADVAPAPEVDVAPGVFTVVFAGNIGEAQDFPAVLDAAELLRSEPVRWLIVGDGRDADYVRAEVDRRGLHDCFRLLGRFPLERMPSFYAHADALLVCLRDEPIFALTIPGKVQSYLAAGKPIIGMLNGEGASVIVDAGAGVVCPAGDAEALAAAVRRLAATTQDARRAMGNNGMTYNAREFDRQHLLDRLEGWLARPQG